MFERKVVCLIFEIFFYWIKVSSKQLNFPLKMSKKEKQNVYSYEYKPRVNGKLLKQKIGKEVILVGFVENVDQNHIIVKSSDNTNVKVRNFHLKLRYLLKLKLLKMN